MRFLEKNCDQPKLRFCSASMLAHREMALAGVGQAAGLAPYIRASDPHLVNVLPEKAFFQHTFWLAAHADRFRLQRVRVVWDYLRILADTHRWLFMQDEDSPVPEKSAISQR